MTSNQIAYWTEKEKERSNRANEAENARHNLASEQIGRLQASAAITGAQAAMLNAQENARHNKAAEKISLLGSAMNYVIGSANASSSRMQAEAAMMGAETTASESTSRKFKNYASGASDVVNALSKGSSLLTLLGIGG